MKVILNSDVANLGEEGDILDVANGYARNYLLPQGLVLEYNTRNLARLEERREAIEQRKSAKRTEAMGVKERLETEDLVITMTAGRNGKLFGSVTSATIADQLSAKGVDVERKKIEVPDKSIKATGNYKVRIRLYGGAEAILTVRVEPDSKTPAPVAEEPAEEEPAAEEPAAEEPAAEEPAAEEPAAEEPAAEEPAAEASAPSEADESEQLEEPATDDVATGEAAPEPEPEDDAEEESETVAESDAADDEDT